MFIHKKIDRYHDVRYAIDQWCIAKVSNVFLTCLIRRRSLEGGATNYFSFLICFCTWSSLSFLPLHLQQLYHVINFTLLEMKHKLDCAIHTFNVLFVFLYQWELWNLNILLSTLFLFRSNRNCYLHVYVLRLCFIILTLTYWFWELEDIFSKWRTSLFRLNCPSGFSIQWNFFPTTNLQFLYVPYVQSIVPVLSHVQTRSKTPDIDIRLL